MFAFRKNIFLSQIINVGEIVIDSEHHREDSSYRRNHQCPSHNHGKQRISPILSPIKEYCHGEGGSAKEIEIEGSPVKLVYPSGRAHGLKRKIRVRYEYSHKNNKVLYIFIIFVYIYFHSLRLTSSEIPRSLRTVEVSAEVEGKILTSKSSTLMEVKEEKQE